MEDNLVTYEALRPVTFAVQCHKVTFSVAASSAASD